MNRFGDIDYSFKKLPPVYGFRSAKIVSLAEALQPIESQIEELAYYIKIAKKVVTFLMIMVYQKINQLRFIFTQWNGKKQVFIVF